MSPTDPPVAYERRIVSVLFADLVGFTSLGELLDPEDVAAIQDRYFAAVRQAVERYGGRLEKFIGDAAMAVFGLPRTLDDDAERAVRCGLAIVAAVERLDAELDLEPGAIAVRVGVATGEVVHAEAGPDAGRVTGDTVNLAARLQTAAPPAGVLVSEPTALAVEEVVELGPARSLELKGKADLVRARTALGTRAIRSREIAMGDLRAATLGREDELRELLGGLEHVRRDQTTERWLVMAPPGTGKTRLLEELARRRPEGVTVRRARFRSDDPRPFGALAELASSVTGRGPAGRSLEGPDLVGRLRAAGLADGRAAVVAAALAELAGANLADAADAGPDAGRASAGQAEGPAGPAGAGPAKVGPDGSTGRTAAETAGVDRDARFEAWIDGIDALAEGGGELWIVEDAHWAGGDALAFLDAVGRRPVPGGRLLVVSARPSLLEREPDWSAAGPGVRRLDLSGLTAGSSEALVRALVGDAIPDELVARVATASDGNCLFIEELLRTWVSLGVLVRDDATWRMTSSGAALAVPATVHAVYGAQLDDLPPAARLAARRAAVAGRRFPVAALPGLGVADPTDAIASLDRRSLISGPTDLPIVGAGYAYRHALLRDAAYASLARAERAVLHAALATWLEATAGRRVDEAAESIGGHYEAALAAAPALAATVAPDLDRATAAGRAAYWLERAAAHAAGQAAHDASADLQRRAIELTPDDRPLDATRRWLELGRALRRAGKADEAVAALERSVALARAVHSEADHASDDRAAARSAIANAGSALALLAFEQLRFLEAWRLADRLLAEIGPPDDVDAALLIMARAMSRAGETNETDAWIADATAVVATSRAAADRRLELEAMLSLTGARSEAGLADADDWRAIAALAGELGDHDVTIRATINAATYLVDERPAEVPAALAPARALAEAWGLAERLAWVDLVECEAMLVTGDWEQGVDAGLRAFDLGESRSFHRVAVRTLSALLPMATLRGEDGVVGRAKAWYERAAERSLPDSPYGRVLNASAAAWFATSGLVPADPPDPGFVHDGLRLEPSGPAWLAGVTAILGAWRSAGRLDDCRAALQGIDDAHRRATIQSTLADGAIGVEAAANEAAGGHPAAATAHARAALGPLREIGAAWWIARALRTLERIDAVTDVERSEAAEIEHRLGLVGHAV